ncbi:hypothetical protein D9M68_760020 [compost metagenome]
MENLALFYAPLLNQINPYKLGDKRRKLEIGEQYARRILLQYHSTLAQDRIRKIVDFLVNSCPDHGYIIDYHLMKPLLEEIVISSKDFLNTAYNDLISQLSTLLILNHSDDDIDFIYNNIVEKAVNNVNTNQEKSKKNSNFAPTKNQRNGKPKSSRKSTSQEANLN